MIAAFDPSELRTIIEEAQRETRSKMKSAQRMIEQYHGPFWTESGEPGAYAPENAYFEYLTAMVPRVVSHNPRVRVRSRRGGPQQDVALAMHHGLNRLVKDQKLSKVLRDLCVDMLFGWGVALVKEDQREGLKIGNAHPIHPATPTWPVCERLDPGRHFMDPDAEDVGSCRYQGHEWFMDKDDLINHAKENPDEGWDMDAIEALAVQTPREAYETGDARKQGVPRLATRKQIQAFDVWFPEIELEDSPGAEEGFHGTVFTIACSSTGGSEALVGADGELFTPENKEGFLREPRPFFGPRTGPYTVFGCYKVPSSPYPLSPLVATEGQIKDLNKQVSAADASMERHKRLIGVPDASTATKVKSQMHDWVISVPFEGEKPLAAEFEIGGHTDRQLETIAMKKERLDRVLGMDDAMRGNVVGGATASEHVLANESAQARASEVVERFTEGTVDVLESMGLYMFYSDTVAFPMGQDVIDGQDDIEVPEYPGLEVEPWFQGGDPDPESGYSYEDLELEIEPYSMPRTPQGLTQQRMLQTHGMIMESLPLMEMYFDYPWVEHFRQIGESMEMPNLQELIPGEMLERFEQQYAMMSQGQVQGQANTQTNAAPRFRDQIGRQATSQASQGAGKADASRVLGGPMQGQQSGAQASSASKPKKVGGK